MQSRSGKRERLERAAKVAIRSFMPDQHREFFQQLPFLVVGSVDANGDPWASMLAAPIGFAQSPTPTTLTVAAQAISGDPLADSLSHVGRPLGILGIELPTRRRNRVNAHISNVSSKHVELTVDQSFGNCPKYIQTRDFEFLRETPEVTDYTDFTHLDKQARQTINTADTFFVASFIKAQNNPAVEGVDVSHRGGQPGFIQLTGNTLTIPDYAGNYFFNTLGNFFSNPVAGLLFPDFITGDLLMLTGRVTLLDEDAPEVASLPGAQRAWQVTVSKGKWLKSALPFRGELKEYSPHTLAIT